MHSLVLLLLLVFRHFVLHIVIRLGHEGGVHAGRRLHSSVSILHLHTLESTHSSEGIHHRHLPVSHRWEGALGSHHVRPAIHLLLGSVGILTVPIFSLAVGVTPLLLRHLYLHQILLAEQQAYLVVSRLVKLL